MAMGMKVLMHEFKRWAFLIVIFMVVAGMAFFMFFEDSGDSLTSSITGIGSNAFGSDESDSVRSNMKDKTNSNQLSTDFSVSLDYHPVIGNSEIRAESVVIDFKNLNNRIQVDEEELSLNDLDEVTLEIEFFEGTIKIDGTLLNMEGKTTQIKVNDVSLSTEDIMDISFQELNFDKLELKNSEIPSLTFSAVSGNLELENKLIYILDEEDLGVDTFSGDLVIDYSEAQETTMDGKIAEFELSGMLDMQVN
jgi:hypothetical protein